MEDVIDTKDTLNAALKFINKFKPNKIQVCTMFSFEKNDGNIISGKDYPKDKYWIVFPWERLGGIKNGK